MRRLYGELLRGKIYFFLSVERARKINKNSSDSRGFVAYGFFVFRGDG